MSDLYHRLSVSPYRRIPLLSSPPRLAGTLCSMPSSKIASGFIPHMAFCAEIKVPWPIFCDEHGGVRGVGIVATRTGEFTPLS